MLPPSEALASLPQARFFDGQSSQPHHVFVLFKGKMVILLSEDGQVLARWSVGSLFLLPKDVPDQPLALSCDQMELSRLIDLDGRLEAAVQPLQLPHSAAADRRTGSMGWKKLVLVGCGAAFSLLAAFFWGVPLLAEVIARNLPTAWERELGDLVSEQIGTVFALNRDDKRPVLCETNKGKAALDAIMAEFQETLPAALPVRLEVWDLPIVNALALPGGRIILFRGMIQTAGNVDALAFVLAHEYAHLVRRHPTEIAIQVAGGAAIISMVVGDVGGGIALGGAAEYLARTGFTRQAEAEADHYALYLMQAGGWNTGPAADLFEKLAANGPNDSKWSWLSTHPALLERAGKLREQAKPNTKDRTRLWHAIRDICD